MKLWLGDDLMPSCDECMSGHHNKCLDLLWLEEYGLFACGCENSFHTNQTRATIGS